MVARDLSLLDGKLMFLLADLMEEMEEKVVT
jgi:hypothetical protein